MVFFYRYEYACFVQSRTLPVFIALRILSHCLSVARVSMFIVQRECTEQALIRMLVFSCIYLFLLIGMSLYILVRLAREIADSRRSTDKAQLQEMTVEAVKAIPTQPLALRLPIPSLASSPPVASAKPSLVRIFPPTGTSYSTKTAISTLMTRSIK